ncbi:hypothetical protein ACQEVZ_30140 [Dactylosporangium sp. CA-152071]|uniref:hypothetical protein n=1 Tax=Dactylosporangium sp. CA-152071 TaxID=3239933 RepID=UPI003D8CCA93
MLTADTYTSVLPESQRRAAAATAELVLTAARAVREQIKKWRNKYGDHGAQSDYPRHSGTARERRSSLRAAPERAAEKQEQEEAHGEQPPSTADRPAV